MGTSASGYHVNSYQLVDIIKNEMLKNGWSIRSTVSDGYDYVFYSSGSDGYHDLYLRVAAGQYDYRTEGDVQKPSPDGYTGYVNFFAYQFYPENGQPHQGSNEVGRHGPALFLTQDQTAGAVMEEYDMIASKTTLARKFTRMTDTGTTTSSVYLKATSGRSKVYYDTSGQTRRRINLEDESGSDTASVSGLSNWTSETPARGFGEYYVDPVTDYHYVYTMNNLSPSTITFNNLSLGTFGRGATSAWNATSSDGSMCKGMARNGVTKLYVARGLDTTSWAAYSIPTNTWSSLLVAPSLGWGGSSAAGSMLFVPKEVTGYASDRLYSTRGTVDNEFQSIAIDDSGDPIGSWTLHASLPVNASGGNKLLFLDSGIFWIPAAQNRNLYRWLFPTSPTASGSWTTVASTFFTGENAGTSVGAFTSAYLHYHLISRVRVSEGQANLHWVVVDEDRVVVATKDMFNKYWYCYAGLFDTFSDTRTTQIIAPAPAASSVLEVDDTSIFKIGEKYVIVDTTGDPSTHVQYSTLETSDSLFAGLNRKFGPSETITISNIDNTGSTITLSVGLTRSYAINSKIGKDPQPVMVRAEDYNEAYVLNNLNLLDNHNSKDPPYQRYRLMPTYEITEDTDNVHRNNSGAIFPIILRDPGLNSVTGSELRGTLRGVYRGGSSFVNGRIYVINGQDYIALIPSDIGTFAEGRGKVLIGPLE